MMHLGRDHRRRRIGSHPAGVRAAVAVEDALVVLARGERQDVLAVDHDDEARLLAVHEFLDDHAVPGFAELVAAEHHVDRLVRFGECRRDHHALAGGEPVGLDHDRRALAVHVVVRGRGVSEGCMARGWNRVPRHEALGELLGGLELRGGLRGAEDAQALGAKRVHRSRGERRLGTHHGGVDAFALRELHQVGDRGMGDVEEAILAGGAGVARRHVHARDLGRLRQAPRHGVLASAGADDQEFHAPPTLSPHRGQTTCSSVWDKWSVPGFLFSA